MSTDPTNDDLRIVSTAYRHEMSAGNGDMEAYRAALEAYLARHPEKSSDAAGREVARLITEASTMDDDWLCGREG